MAKKGNRPGRRALRARIEKLQHGANKVVLLESKMNMMRQVLAKANDGEKRAIDQAERERRKGASVCDMLGHLKLRIMPAANFRHAKQFDLCVSIVPDAYIMPFLYGGGDRFRDVGGYFSLVAMDVAKKIEQCLREEYDKTTGAVNAGS